MSKLLHPTEPQEHGPVKSFLEHLEDLRWLLIKIIVSLAGGLILCLFLVPKILRFLEYPLELSGIQDSAKALWAPNPMDPFTIYMQLALYVGLLISAPLIIGLIGSYLLPALTQKERRHVLSAFWLGSLFFFVGVTFSYFLILPPSLRISKELAQVLHLNAEIWKVDDYLSFVIYSLVGTGIAFELPLVILILLQFGVLNRNKLATARRYVVVGIFIFAAILTPGSDLFSLLVTAIPMLIMYEICVWIAWFRERR